MANQASFSKWTVLPHEPLQQLEDNLWRLEGTLPKMPLRRVMTIVSEAGHLRRVSRIRPSHVPTIAVDDAGAVANRLEALGRIAFIVVPNGWHRLDLRAFHERYPAAVVMVPRPDPAPDPSPPTGATPAHKPIHRKPPSKPPPVRKPKPTEPSYDPNALFLKKK